MSPRFRLKKNTVPFFLLISLLIHLVLVLLFPVVMDVLHPEAPPQPVMVELKNFLPQQRLPLADIPKPKKQQKPKKATAESLYDQTVKEETVQSHTAPEKPQTPKGSSAPPQPKEPKPKEAKKETPKDAIPIKPSEPTDPLQRFDELYGKKSTRIPGMPEASMGNAGGTYLPKIKMGGKTYLNTEANPNLAYLIELKRRFQMTWNPLPYLRGTPRPGSGHVQAMLGLSINRQGQLVEVKILQTSGVENYDYEGVRTVRSSAPFSAPPAQYVGEDGMVNLAWFFTVYY